MDGLVEVTLPSLRKVRVPIERLTRLRENMEQFEDLLGDDISNENADDYSFNEGSYEVQGEDGTWARPEGRDEGDARSKYPPFALSTGPSLGRRQVTVHF